MATKKLIHVIAGWLLLLVFSFSITPKQYLHDVFAGHQDMAATAKSKDTQVAKQGYDCECNTLVATSPFTEQEELPLLQPPTFYQPSYTAVLAEGYSSSSIRLYELRGPPALA